MYLQYKNQILCDTSLILILWISSCRLEIYYSKVYLVAIKLQIRAILFKNLSCGYQAVDQRYISQKFILWLSSCRAIFFKSLSCEYQVVDQRYIIQKFILWISNWRLALYFSKVYLMDIKLQIRAIFFKSLSYGYHAVYLHNIVQNFLIQI